MNKNEFYEWAEDRFEEIDHNLYSWHKAEIANEIYEKSLEAGLTKCEREPYKDFYIDHLLAYGYDEKSRMGNLNISSELIKQALSIEPSLPIAHYRLGHICFQRSEYGLAIYHFKESQRKAKNKKYNLVSFQSDHAAKLMGYACLKLFDEVKERVLVVDEYHDLDNVIQKYTTVSDSDLNPIALWRYTVGSKVIKRRISVEEYHELKNKVESDDQYAYVDTYVNFPTIGYRGSETHIGDVHLNVLMNILNQDTYQFVSQKTNTTNQQVKRLRENLSSIGLYPPVFEIENKVGMQRITASPIIFHLKSISE